MVKGEDESVSLFNSEDGYYLELAVIAYDSYCKTLRTTEPLFSSLPLCNQFAWMSAAGTVFEYLKENSEWV